MTRLELLPVERPELPLGATRMLETSVRTFPLGVEGMEGEATIEGQEPLAVFMGPAAQLVDVETAMTQFMRSFGARSFLASTDVGRAREEKAEKYAMVTMRTQTQLRVLAPTTDCVRTVAQALPTSGGSTTLTIEMIAGMTTRMIIRRFTKKVAAEALAIRTRTFAILNGGLRRMGLTTLGILPTSHANLGMEQLLGHGVETEVAPLDEKGVGAGARGTRR